MQGAGHHCSSHQIPGHRRKQDQDSWTTGPGSARSPCPLRGGGWADRGCYAQSLRQHLQEGGVTVVAICELDTSSYCFLLINCLDVKKKKGIGDTEMDPPCHPLTVNSKDCPLHHIKCRIRWSQDHGYLEGWKLKPEGRASRMEGCEVCGKAGV